MIILKPLVIVILATISFISPYTNALDCYLPQISEKVQPTIDNPKASAVVRGILKIPKQKYSYDWGEFFSRYSATRSLNATIDGYVANTNGFSKPISLKVTLEESCDRWPDTNICVKNETVASSVEAKPSIYFLDKTKNGYVLVSGDCSMNSMEATPEDIKEIATCFINGGC